MSDNHKPVVILACQVMQSLMQPHLPDAQIPTTYLDYGLHIRPERMTPTLQAQLDALPEPSLVLVGYGLCGNALQNPEELLADAGVPVFLPMDQDHPVDDCVGLIIGGRECYYNEQCKVAGTFFIIPGWTRHWKDLFKKEYGSFDVEFVRRKATLRALHSLI